MAMRSNKKQQGEKASTIQFDKRDTLWDEPPKIGLEGLIATIEDEEELRQKLVESSEYQKKLKRGENG